MASGFPPQKQETQPGVQHAMDPTPQFSSPNYKPSNKLHGKVALVTGGDSGIGRAVCHCYALEGATVAFTYVKGREDKDADETLRLLHEAKTKEAKEPIMIATDLGFEENCKRTVDEVVNAFGRIDVLVNCAAEQHEVSIDEIEEARLERVFRTNIFSQFFLAKYALKHMKEGSSIINTTSVVAYAGSSSLLEYASTKGAIVSFTRALALQLASKGIRVNGVAPGPVWTPLITASFSEEAIKQFGSETPMKRAAQPVEVAPSYVFLACEHCSSYYTGQILHPNGDSEFKTKLECVKKAFPTKSDSWRIVTQGDVERQPSPTRTIKLFSIASSGPVQTAPQDNKPVSKLKQSLGNKTEKTSPFIKRRHGCKVLFSVEEEVETVSKHGVSTEIIFIKERYNNNRITKTLMNPSEILKLFTQTHTSEVNRMVTFTVLIPQD